MAVLPRSAPLPCPTGIELSKGANPILLLLMLMILLPQSNLESKSMIKSKRQGVSPNSMAVLPCPALPCRSGRFETSVAFRRFPQVSGSRILQGRSKAHSLTAILKSSIANRKLKIHPS
jgi:hypothetical protein